MSPNDYDIWKTAGGRYQVFRLNDNTPVEESKPTRSEAEEVMNRVYADEYGFSYTMDTMHGQQGQKIEYTVAARTSEQVDVGKKDLTSGQQPGVVTRGKKTPPKNPKTEKGNPAVSRSQQKFFGAELGRKRAGKKTETGLSEKKLKEFASTGRKDLPERKKKKS